MFDVCVGFACLRVWEDIVIHSLSHASSKQDIAHLRMHRNLTVPLAFGVTGNNEAAREINLITPEIQEFTLPKSGAKSHYHQRLQMLESIGQFLQQPLLLVWQKVTR